MRRYMSPPSAQPSSRNRLLVSAYVSCSDTMKGCSSSSSTRFSRSSHSQRIMPLCESRCPLHTRLSAYTRFVDMSRTSETRPYPPEPSCLSSSSLLGFTEERCDMYALPPTTGSRRWPGEGAGDLCLCSSLCTRLSSSACSSLNSTRKDSLSSRMSLIFEVDVTVAERRSSLSKARSPK